MRGFVENKGLAGHEDRGLGNISPQEGGINHSNVSEDDRSMQKKRRKVKENGCMGEMKEEYCD